VSETLILGAGLAGLSCAYHLGHERCRLLERAGHAYGHISTEIRDGFTWDEGPHVSFTKHAYVKELFAESVAGEFEEFPVRAGNYFRGSWIEHPAQSNLYQVPEPLRGACVDSFLATRSATASAEVPRDYADWLEQAFGPVFAGTFPAAYTRKYWTCEPRDLTTEWVGNRVFHPAVEDVVEGSRGPLSRQTHYITHVRYPRRGGYQHFAEKLAAGARIEFGADVVSIDLAGKRLWTSDGREWPWERLVNTLPLPVFIAACSGVPAEVVAASRELSCSSALLVNVAAPHPTARDESWIYVYDEDKYSTRINCTEMLASGNAPAGRSGIQVEAYASRHKPFDAPPEVIARRVVDELIEMGLVTCPAEDVHWHTKLISWANVIFTHRTASSLDVIWRWLEGFGLQRETDDLHPLSDWTERPSPQPGALAMAGRFGQWKYFWTDDCVMRGRQFQKD